MSHIATVGLLSIGDMGVGIAKLLMAHNYRVVTNVEGRSQDTHARALKASIEMLPSDVSLVTESDYILSIVPPRDALATAKRISTAFNAQATPKTTPLYYLDLNAISPRSAREIADLFHTTAPLIRLIDGGIIGGPPSLRASQNSTVFKTNVTIPPPSSHAWSRPSIPVSGPHKLSSSDAPASGASLAEVLCLKDIGDDIGKASGLKCCFASTTKGFTALCIQAFTTAQSLGVLEELKMEMGDRIPGMLKTATGGVTSMPPKAYRWVREMEEIALTHADEGGFNGDIGIYGEIAKVYKRVFEDTVLGEEKTERRKRGLTVEDVAEAMSEGLQGKKRKTE